MACQCGNFLKYTASAGKCNQECPLHPSTKLCPQLIVHVTYSSGGLTESIEEKKRKAEDISYETTLSIKHDRLCPKCKNPVRATFDANGMYLYVCTTCHAWVEKPTEVEKK